MPLTPYPIKLTDEQVEAINSAFTDPEMTFSDKVRKLLSVGLLAHSIVFPDTPKHGGKRQGAGRKYLKEKEV